jgi:chromosome segregation ATPase
VEPQVLGEASGRIRTDNHPHVHPHERMDPVQTALSVHPGMVQAAEPALVAILSRQIERLEKELGGLQERLEGATSERDAERLRSAALSVTVDALKAALETERQRVSDLRHERDRWAGTAETSQRQLTDLTGRKGFRRWFGLSA